MKINVVLFEPEIPQNTGNIMRTCSATNTVLHLIEPLGFKIDEQKVRRSGLDYRLVTESHFYANWDDFVAKNKGYFVYITRYGHKPPSAFDFTKVIDQDIYLIFGKESTGLPLQLLHDNLDSCARLPMVASARSLNLSNCVAICVYEVLRQLDYLDLSCDEVIKGNDWLERLK